MKRVVEARPITELLVEKFQCPGCTLGGSTKCGSYDLFEQQDGWCRCKGHSAGTFMGGAGRLLLSAPIGFNRYGPFDGMGIRLWAKPPVNFWDALNVPVWATEHDGALWVRTYAPRINQPSLDIVWGGKLALVPTAIDVASVVKDMD